MKALDPIKDAEWIRLHAICTADATRRREALGTHERSRHESHTYAEPVRTPESETPALPEWDDLP
jgi:hypothetical protein